jgi:hypothetical protein
MPFLKKETQNGKLEIGANNINTLQNIVTGWLDG